MAEDGRLVVSFSEIFDQIKIAIIDQPFIVKLMAWEGGVWGITFLIHRGQGDRR